MNTTQFEAIMGRINALEQQNGNSGGKDYSALSYPELQKEAKRRGVKANQSKNDLVKALGGKPADEWVNENTEVVERDGRPVAYALKQVRGGEVRIRIGSYARIPKKRLKGGVKPYYIETSWKDRNGKKVKGYYVPMKKGSFVLYDKVEAKTLTSVF